MGKTPAFPRCPTVRSTGFLGVLWQAVGSRGNSPANYRGVPRELLWDVSWHPVGSHDTFSGMTTPGLVNLVEGLGLIIYSTCKQSVSGTGFVRYICTFSPEKKIPTCKILYRNIPSTRYTVVKAPRLVRSDATRGFIGSRSKCREDPRGCCPNPHP